MDPFIGQIIMFGGNFAPVGWAFCEGQLLPIAQNTALFSLLGTTYGGDGRTTFALPDLRGRVPIHPGQGIGLPNYTLGQRGGQASITLGIDNLPPHEHTVSPPANTGEGQNTLPGGAVPAAGEMPTQPYATTSDTTMAPYSTGPAGGGLAFDSMPPYVAVNFIIALQGIFPSRS
jgi:microcystin-dependent protein